MTFFHYGEDTNYCQRVLYHGFSIIADTRCTICHDREDRKGYTGNSKEYPLVDEKKYWGNINKEFDFAKMKKSLKKKIFKRSLLCKFQEVREMKKELSCIESVESSRKINVVKGRHWL